MPELGNTVDWSTLEHAYGTAEDIPGLLGELASGDQETRHGAFGELLHSLVHQGTRYQASAYAVPALLDLVADPAQADREFVALLLVWIAIGSDEAWLPDGIRIDELRQRASGGAEVLARGRTGRTTAEHVAVDTYAALRGWEAVRDGLPVLRSLLDGADLGLRTIAAYTLGWFPADAAPAGAEPSLAALADLVAEADADQGLVAVALVSAGLLGADGSARLARAALDDPRPLVRWAGAIALARLDGPAADPRVATELLHWAGGGSRRDQEFPFLGGDLAGYATLALRQLGPASADAAFAATLARLPLVHAEEALTVLGEALRYAFPDGPVPGPAPFEQLDERQRRLVRVLADAPGSWRYDEFDFGNFSMLVAEYGLPGDHGKMRRYADPDLVSD
ncbi:HEAT repeat domain-containing protein [Micromonospora sp. NPDC050397]|uniref:HEAT repeat domain-containing protein n=1 Tax=Micromonospora sp. NPDC050397 TaxID=3364279 RepID=UPI00384E6D90